MRQIVTFTAALLLLSLSCARTAQPPATVPTVAPTAVPLPTATAAPTPTSPPQMAVYTPERVSVPCEFYIPAGVTVACSFVRVPEYRYGDPADTIELMVAVYRSHSQTPAADPVVYLQGGPGSEAVTWAAGFYAQVVEPILAERDFVVYDARGLGFSRPNLDCLEIRAVYAADRQPGWTEDERLGDYSDAFLDCRRRLVGEGVNLAAYTTEHSAADVRDIVMAMGYEQVNLYAISYGTRLAQVIMRDYPAIVRSVVLDSVVPLEANLYNERLSRVAAALDALFAGCAADPACQAAYPDLEGAFYELLAQFKENPLQLPLTNPETGVEALASFSDADFINAIVGSLHAPGSSSLVPQLIYDLQAGDYSQLAMVRRLPPTAFDGLNIGHRLSIECHDQIFSTTAEQLQSALDAQPPLAAYGRMSYFGNPDFLPIVCSLWGAAPFVEGQMEPLVSDIPALVVAGEYDPTTPAYYGRQIAERLSHSYFFEFAGLGHAPTVGVMGNCPLAVTLAFLRDPAVRPAEPCLATLNSPPFVVPFDGVTRVALEPFTNDLYGLNGLVPVGWLDVGQGFYNREAFLFDPTQIGMQSAEGITSEEWLAFLQENYQGRGYDRGLTSPAGGREANGLAWRLYQATYLGNPLDIALAESESGVTVMVILLSRLGEREGLYEGLFLPVVDGLQLVDG